MVNRDEFVNRLRQSGDLTREQGAEVGRKWATDSAEKKELKRLERARDIEQPWDRGGAYASSYERLASVIRPESENDRQSAVDFWEEILGDEIEVTHDDDWLRGFAEGALSAWDDVADEV